MMKLRFTKKDDRSVLTCIRADGSQDCSSTSHSTALHDLAHFIVETELKLTRGFYGNIARGFTIEQLSSKEVIRQLDEEAIVAEITTRSLQSLYSGACTAQQFSELINAEFRVHGIRLTVVLPQATVARMHHDYSRLVHQWNGLPDGESLELQFEIATGQGSQDR